MEPEFEDVLDDIAEASVVPELWQDVVIKIGKLCPDAYINIMLYDKISDRVPWDYNTMEGEVKRQYEQHYSHVNSLWPVMQSQEEGTVTDTDFFDAMNKINGTEFYHDFLCAQKCDYIIGGSLETAPGSKGVCTLGYIGKVNRDHVTPSRKILENLLPAMQRSFNITRRFAGQSFVPRTAAAQVQALVDPAFIVGRGGKVEHMNRAGAQALSQMRGISSGFGDKLVINDPAAQNRFEAHLKTVLIAEDPATQAEGVIALSSYQLSFPLKGEDGGCAVTLIPVREKHSGENALIAALVGVREKKVMVVLQYEQDLHQRLGAILLSRFDLTPKEIAVSIAMMKGIPVQDYAEHTNRKETTIRKQLSTIFSKTDTHHQHELAALLHGYKDMLVLDSTINPETSEGW